MRALASADTRLIIGANTVSRPTRNTASAPHDPAAVHDQEPDARGRRRPRAYVVSDVLLYREGLSAHLHKNDRLAFLGAGPPGEPTLKTLERLLPDAVILDLAMRDALEFAAQIRDRIAGAKTVAFAVSDLDSRVVACAKAGICGYVPKDGTAEDIVLAVLHAVKGELHCTPKFAAMLLGQLAAVAPETTVAMLRRAPRLTPRELEILEQIDRGLSNKEIARLLGISAATVKNHVHQLLAKLSVRRRAQALAFLRGYAVAKPSEITL
jgi:DNA-binding NarL/FixJ family response regulator